MNKKLITIVFIMLLGTVFSVSGASANHGRHKGHGTSHQSWDLKGKFFHKVVKMEFYK